MEGGKTHVSMQGYRGDGSGGESSEDDYDSDYENFDHLIKLIIIGNSAVGKTCICVRFSGADFP